MTVLGIPKIHLSPADEVRTYHHKFIPVALKIVLDYCALFTVNKHVCYTCSSTSYGFSLFFFGPCVIFSSFHHVLLLYFSFSHTFGKEETLRNWWKIGEEWFKFRDGAAILVMKFHISLSKSKGKLTATHNYEMGVTWKNKNEV